MDGLTRLGGWLGPGTGPVTPQEHPLPPTGKHGHDNHVDGHAHSHLVGQVRHNIRRAIRRARETGRGHEGLGSSHAVEPVPTHNVPRCYPVSAKPPSLHTPHPTYAQRNVRRHSYPAYSNTNSPESMADGSQQRGVAIVVDDNESESSGIWHVGRIQVSLSLYPIP